VVTPRANNTKKNSINISNGSNNQSFKEEPVFTARTEKLQNKTDNKINCYSTNSA